jgi:hypothetical protein
MATTWRHQVSRSFGRPLGARACAARVALTRRAAPIAATSVSPALN